ncbi:MAG TPA: sulfatase-like hydrolase/transferase [Thermoanaerobaculia bacterium]|jgi:arylsulfatase A-like enzyme/tetratricopeptide (TPR) repeat protein|nr:sulfatase-like hydrolase/transferase [Thermoanaerobaculia bacterium]
MVPVLGERSRLVAAALLVALLVAADRPASSAPAAGHPASRPDILLVTIDTLRADATGFGGNPKGTTPLLDRVAHSGRVFGNAHAQNVVTLPSHTNILTGLYPYQHGVRDNSGFRLGAATPTLATVLHGAGYATGAFVSGYPLAARFGLARGFDVYDDHFSSGGLDDQFALAERRGDETVAAALTWWRGQRGHPRFLWVHLYDAHAPYVPPEPFARRFADPYLGEVAAADSFLAPLLSPLLAGGEPPALVVVTADHGESRGEHGELTHGLFAYEATLHVPLVLWGTGVAAGRDDRPAGHVDLFPTVLAAAGVAAPAGGPPRPGRSLLRPWTAAESRADLYFEALSTALNRGWAPLRGLLRGGRKYIHLPLAEAYDLPRDPREEKNLVDADRRAVRAAFAALPVESQWPPPRQAVSSEETKRLASLGYLSEGGGGGGGFRPEDDPKNLIALDRLIEGVIDAYSRGALAQAVAGARKLVKERPAMPLGHSLLAQALLQAGRDDEALEVMRQARARGSASANLQRQLALTLAEQGKIDEARAVVAPLAGAGDAEARVILALTDSEAGRQREAFEQLQGVLADDAHDAGAWETLALVELRLGHWPRARDAARRAVEFEASRSRAWNDLGVALFQLGDAPGALDAWQRAVALDPQLWDALWNLGIQASKHGRTQVARDALSRFVAAAPRDRYGKDIEEARRLLAALGHNGG